MPITMFAFEEMFHNHIKNSGMLIPENSKTYNPFEFPHYYVFMNLHCGQTINTDHLYDNAKLIASIPFEELKDMTLQDFINKGLLVQNYGDWC